VLLEPYEVSDRPKQEQPRREPEDVEVDLESVVERIVKSEIITYTRKVRRANKEFKEHEQKKLWFASEGILALHRVDFASQQDSVHPVKEDSNFEGKMAR